jgi:hypothetical protein
MITILVCGGRDFDNWSLLREILTKIHEEKTIGLLIHGAARGADSMAGVWAIRNGIKVKRVPAKWKTYGKAAGPIRNTEMLKLEPDIVVAFPGGTGTADMVTKARAASIEVIEL